MSDQSLDLFDELVAESATLTDGWVGCTHYRAIPVTEVADGDMVLPAGWGKAAKALALNASEPAQWGTEKAAETLDDRHVRVYWQFGPDASTVFHRHEKVLVARW